MAVGACQGVDADGGAHARKLGAERRVGAYVLCVRRGELLEERAEDGELGLEGLGVGGAEGGAVGGELGGGDAGAVEGGDADAFAGHDGGDDELWRRIRYDGCSCGGWSKKKGETDLHEKRREERLGGELCSGGEDVRVEPEIEVEETRRWSRKKS